MSNRLVARTGWALITIGVLAISPLTDLLPVDVIGFGRSQGTVYLKVVPAEAIGPPAIALAGSVLVAVGLILLIWSRLRRSGR